jgi:hypothetical protein
MKQENEQRGPAGDDLPGYPHYPPQEDITQPANNNGKVTPDEENNPLQANDARQETRESEELEIVMGTEADITAEDLDILEMEDCNIIATRLDDRDEDGELLNEGSNLKDVGADLDVPGSEHDDDNEAIGEEDEENNYYSLGDNDTTEDTEGIP